MGCIYWWSLISAADGTIVPFDGEMDDYARFVLDRAKGGAAPGQMRTGKQKRRRRRKLGVTDAQRHIAHPMADQRSIVANRRRI